MVYVLYRRAEETQYVIYKQSDALSAKNLNISQGDCPTLNCGHACSTPLAQADATLHMSRRTTPLLGASPSPSSSSSGNPPSNLSIFYALEQGRFDLVRRAVANEPHTLYARNAQGDTPIAAALYLARHWDAVLTHCTRTGSGPPDARRKRTSLAAASEWLLSLPDSPPPPPDALHIALACDLAHTACALLNRSPSLASYRDSRRRTPLHIVFALAPRLTPMALLSYTNLLRGCSDMKARDSDGATPLHHLVQALLVAQTSLGLTRVGLARRAPLAALSSVLECAILDGADILAEDKKGRTPLDMAIRGTLDHLALVRTADSVYRKLCKPSHTLVKDGCTIGYQMGDFDILPYDVLYRIVRELPPRDAVKFSTTCRAARAFASTPDLWKNLSAIVTMAYARNAIFRDLRGGIR